MPCRERDVLTKIYVEAVARNNDAAAAMAVFTGAKQIACLDEVKILREACQEALNNLDAHMKEHGC